jgi:hypothetical protein
MLDHESGQRCAARHANSVTSEHALSHIGTVGKSAFGQSASQKPFGLKAPEVAWGCTIFAPACRQFEASIQKSKTCRAAIIERSESWRFPCEWVAWLINCSSEYVY